MFGTVALGLAACGGGDAPPAAKSSAPLKVLLASAPTSLDPIVGAGGGGPIAHTILDPLVGTGADLEPDKTGVLTEWTRTDPTTWTFTVRPGLKFTNGEVGDAAAVANTILLSRDAKGALLKSYFANVASAEASGPTTVVVKTNTPEFDLPNLLMNVFLLPPKYYAEQGSEGFAAAPIGTGPYALSESQAGRSYTVKANPEYWGEQPATDTLVFTWSTEASQRLALLQSKSVDVAFGLSYTQAEEASKAGLSVTTVESASKMVVFLQSTTAPFDDPKVREAAALAIDRDAIVKGIFDGHAKADAGLLNIKPGEEPKESVTSDPAKAKELIGDSAPSLQLTYPANQYLNLEEVSQAVGGSLEQAGFKVEYNPVDYGTLTKQLVAKQLTGAYILAAVPNVAVPNYFATGFMKTKSITGNCPDEQMDTLITQALEQPDAAAAQSIYDEINTIGVVQKHCYVPLYKQEESFGTLPGIKGVELNALKAITLTKASR